tara:strand:+ start:960 stop:1250 length:291 start_codon:yes stop_codon:yes gene_type:complete
MGIISAIIALLKAVPSLERLFLKIADGVKEARAKERFNAKLDHIDAALAAARDNGGVWDGQGAQWSEGADRTPAVPEGSTTRATVDEIGLKESSGT